MPLVAGQVVSLSGTSGGTITLPGTVQAGNRIIVTLFVHNVTPTAPTCSGCTFYQNGPTVTDAGGNTYTVWSGVPAANFSGAITINGTSTNFFMAEGQERSGLSGSTGSTGAGVDVSVGASGQSTTPSSGATPAAGTGGELVGFCGHDGQDTSLTSGGNITTVEHTNLTASGSTAWGDNNSIAAGGTPTATFNGTATARWGCIAIVYLAAAVIASALVPQGFQGPRFRVPVQPSLPLPGQVVPPSALTPQWVTRGPQFRYPLHPSLPLGEDINLPIPISAVDTGLGTDAPVQIGLSAADIATGTDGVTQLDLTGADDTSSGSDAVTQIGLTGASDVGAGTDAASQIALAGADAGTGADGVGQVGLNTTDAGTATDGASVFVLAFSVILLQGIRGPQFKPSISGMVPLGSAAAPISGPGPLNPPNTIGVLQARDLAAAQQGRDTDIAQAGRDMATVGGRDATATSQGRSTVKPT